MSGFEEYSTVSQHILETGNVDPTLTSTPTWVDIELNSTIVCTSMSRAPIRSIVEQTPPLYIAIGTESGLVLVQEILPPTQNNTNSPTGNITTTTSTISTSNNNNSLDIGYTIPRAHTDNTMKDDNTKKEDGDMERKLSVSTTVQHQGRMRCVDFSPDRQYLAVGGDDCKCHIYQHN
jgi:hypothetical protein